MNRDTLGASSTFDQPVAPDCMRAYAQRMKRERVRAKIADAGFYTLMAASLVGLFWFFLLGGIGGGR